MSLLTFDRVKETSTTTGTGALTLAGAVSGFRTFASVLAANDLCYYCIALGTEWEVGLGTFNTTLTRTTVFASSNAGALVAFSAGAKEVFITAPARREYIPFWIMQTADYTLANSAAEQKAFNTTPNGTLALPAGVYEFECFLYMLGMSATSGNAAFDPIGAGTAVGDRFGYDVAGVDAATPVVTLATVTGTGSVVQQTGASMVVTATAIGMRAKIEGMFRISTAGTIIPSVTLVTATAAALVKAGSYFKIAKIGESSETSHGHWT